jgi:hypothetical protein
MTPPPRPSVVVKKCVQVELYFTPPHDFIFCRRRNSLLFPFSGSEHSAVQLSLVILHYFFPENGSCSETSDSGIVFPLFVSGKNNSLICKWEK